MPGKKAYEYTPLKPLVDPPGVASRYRAGNGETEKKRIQQAGGSGSASRARPSAPVALAQSPTSPRGWQNTARGGHEFS